MQSVLFSIILKDCTSDRRPCIFHAAETKSNRLSEKAHRISHEDNHGSYVSFVYVCGKWKPSLISTENIKVFLIHSLTAVEHLTTEIEIFAVAVFNALLTENTYSSRLHPTF